MATVDSIVVATVVVVTWDPKCICVFPSLSQFWKLRFFTITFETSKFESPLLHLIAQSPEEEPGHGQGGGVGDGAGVGELLGQVRVAVAGVVSVLLLDAAVILIVAVTNMHPIVTALNTAIIKT